MFCLNVHIIKDHMNILLLLMCLVRLPEMIWGLSVFKPFNSINRNIDILFTDAEETPILLNALKTVNE